MSYTPVELRHVHVGRRLLGYNRRSVEKILDEVAESFETVWRDRGELADQVESLSDQLEELKSRERLLVETLSSAEQVAREVKEQAEREAEVILAEAHQQARSVWLSAQAERERLFAEARRIEVCLRAALEVVAKGTAEEQGTTAEEPPQWRHEAGDEPATVVDSGAGDVPEPSAAEASAPEDERSLRQRFLPKVVGGDPRGLD
jgi:cell division initiation protein